MKGSISKILGSSLLVLSLLVSFQNCQNGGFSSDANSSSLSSSGQGLEGLPSIEDQNTPASNVLSAIQTGSEKLAVDCSDPSAYMIATISNAGSDILLCLEFDLDMPVGHARYGEKARCTSSDQFSVPRSHWQYDSGKRQWSSQAIYTRNHEAYVPGSYRIVVKDNQGAVSYSNNIVLKKANSANCFASSTATTPPQTSQPVCYYNWKRTYTASCPDPVFGGVQDSPMPAGSAVCNASTVGATTTDANSNSCYKGLTLTCTKECR